MKRSSLWFLSLLLPIAGVVLVLLNTQLGAYLSDDSYYYVYPARELAAGRGFQPSYIFAPLYPFILALIGLTGIDPLVSGRWLNALLFGVNLLLVVRITRRSGAPHGFGLLAGSLVLLSDVVIEAHGWLMSEALAFTFLLLCLDFSLAYISSARRAHFWLAALFCALTLLSRYAALPLAAAVSLALLLFPPSRRWTARLTDALVFGAASLAPLALYWLRNQLTSGHPVRYLNYFQVPFTQDQAVWFAYNWLSLFIPGRFLRGRELLAGAAALALAVLLLLLIGWVYRKRWAELRGGSFSASMFLLAAVLLLNLLMLYLARGLTELDVFNLRYLVPLLIVFLILIAGLTGQIWQWSGKWTRAGLIAFFAVFVVYYAYRTADFTQKTMPTGLGYANITWHNSDTIPYLLSHPELTDLVSTGEMGIYFWSGRMPKVIAVFSNPAALREYLCKNQATLLLMDQMPASIYGMERSEVIQKLELVRQFNDGEMYRCPPGK